MSVKSGEHLRVVRSWMQRKALNGDRVTWSSDEFLTLRPLTVLDLEQLAQEIADALSLKKFLEKCTRLSLVCECGGNGREIIQTCANCELVLEVKFEAQGLLR